MMFRYGRLSEKFWVNLKYNNKFFRTVDERFRLFLQKISREIGNVGGQASLVQSTNKVEKESGRIYAKLMKTSALKKIEVL